MTEKENADGGKTPKLDMDIEAIRHFHTGPLQRCSQCGRPVFNPCLICETERKGKVFDPFDGVEGEEAELLVELQDEERERFQYLHLQKVAEEARQWAQEEHLVFP